MLILIPLSFASEKQAKIGILGSVVLSYDTILVSYTLDTVSVSDYNDWVITRFVGSKGERMDKES